MPLTISDAMLDEGMGKLEKALVAAERVTGRQRLVCRWNSPSSGRARLGDLCSPAWPEGERVQRLLTAGSAGSAVARYYTTTIGVLPFDAVVEVDHVLVDHAHAARRHGLADGLPFRRAVDAEAGVLAVLEDVERPRAERVVQPAGLAVRAISPVPACARSFRPAASRSAISCRTGCWRGPTTRSRRCRCRRRSGARRRPAAPSRDAAPEDARRWCPAASPVGSTTICAPPFRVDLLERDFRQHEALVGERGVHQFRARHLPVDADLGPHRIEPVVKSSSSNAADPARRAAGECRGAKPNSAVRG